MSNWIIQQKISCIIYLLFLIMISCKSDDNNKIKQETISQVSENNTNKSLVKVPEIILCDKGSSLIFIIETIKIVFDERDSDLQMNLVDLKEIRTPLISDEEPTYSISEYAFQSKNEKT